MDLYLFMFIYFRVLVEVKESCFDVKRRLENHGLDIEAARPDASPLAPPNDGAQSRRIFSKFP